VCILNEKQWQSKSRVWRGEATTERVEEDTKFTVLEQITDNTYLMEFTVSDSLAHELERTGSFVFLRRPDDPQYFHFPVGVMNVNGNSIQVVVEAIGPKSKRLLEAENRDVLVRGPYYNGVLGQPWIDNITCGTILLVTGGMGQPPALPIAAKLRENNNEVIAVVAPGKVGKVFIANQMEDMGVTVYTVDSMRRSGINIISRWLEAQEKPDLIISAGPDEQHYGVITIMQSVGVNIPMAATNNATMCCGEGICGSCERETKDSRLVRVCKVQTDFTQFVT
jgi:NAD(P)H-flavin reductase